MTPSVRVTVSKNCLFVSQVANFPSQNVKSYSENGKTGKIIHYGAMAWGATTRVGCGYISFMDKSTPETPFRRVYKFLQYFHKC